MTDIFFGISATEWAEILRNYALGVSAILTAFVAYSGLNSWKDQQEWNEKRKAAITALLSIEKLERTILNNLVNPFSDDQLNELLPQKDNFNGNALTIATVIENNVSEKSSALKGAISKFEDSLIPAAIIFDENFKIKIHLITAWANLFLVQMSQLSLAAKFPMLAEEDCRKYIENYKRETFSPDQVSEVSSHGSLKHLSDLEIKIRAHGGVAS